MGLQQVIINTVSSSVFIQNTLTPADIEEGGKSSRGICMSVCAGVHTTLLPHTHGVHTLCACHH